ncbi:hypothetical protein CANINC_003570 [Pichia inconspicua]|uniref:Uncharacterized protein n=1 Tax=Pichia inconspicua TaxID=52247 RepID=A0A4T0WZU7_9ASCO|nr:hypothetical protein CANINC_003570 [[Candida] inconspicua]
MNAENDGFKNRISIIGDLNNVINLTMNNVSFRENRSLTKSTIKNKSNFQSSTKISHFHINNVYDTVKKRTQVFGVRGWIANNVRPLTKRTIRNILAPKDHSSTFQPSTIPLIQQADFFKRNDMQSREKGFGNSRNHHSHHSIARYHQYQIKENIRLNGSIQKKKLESLGGNNLKESLVVRYRRPGLGTNLAFDSLQSKITNADGIVTRSDLLGTIGRNRAIESLITQISLKQKKNSLDNNLSQKETVLTEPKKPESRWRIFSGLRQHRLALKKARITESRTSNVKTEKEEDVHEEVPKITSLQLPVATEDQVEFGEIATQYTEQERSTPYPSMDDVYEIFASYEELHT